MPTATPSSFRLTARVNDDTHALIERAAAIAGSTVNQFLVTAARKEAEAIIERETLIRLSARDGRAFLEALDRPAAPNAKLRAAAKRYKDAKLADH